MEQAIWSFSVIMEKVNNLPMITQLVSVTTRVYIKLIFLIMSLCYYFITVMSQSGQLFPKEFMKVAE